MIQKLTQSFDNRKQIVGFVTIVAALMFWAVAPATPGIKWMVLLTVSGIAAGLTVIYGIIGLNKRAPGKSYD